MFIRLSLIFFALAGVSAFSAGTSVRFNHGTAPLEIAPPTGRTLSARECRDCHSRIDEDWRKTRHAAAWTNDLFQEGFLVESQDRCIYCHAPLRQQFEAIRKAENSPLPHEGVNCATCHVREQAILTAGPSGETLHLNRHEPLLKKAEFCAGCHQFNFNRQVNGTSVLEPLVVQNTYQEWQAYRDAGGVKSCQECHMPNGRHLFRGAHDLPFLRSSLFVEVIRRPNRTQVRFRPRDVGHSFPTGDLFRYLSFEVRKAGEKEYRTVYTIGKRYGLQVNEFTGKVEQTLDSDTALRPFETRSVDLPLTGAFSYRVRYHYTSRKNEWISLLRPEELVRTLASGESVP